MTSRRRWASLLASLTATATVAGIAAVPGAASDQRVPRPAARVVDAAAAGEPTATTATTQPALPPLPADGLRVGSEGEAVLALEQALVARHYDPGEPDTTYDTATQYAVMAFEKVMGMEPSGKVDPLVWAALATASDPEPLLPDGGPRRVEVDIPRQLLLLYSEGELTLISHVSTGSGKRYCAPGGCGVAITPGGAHRFMWRVNGWRTSRLGRLFNPVYFTGGGIAVHGYHSVPTHPASHGCVRVPMHIAEWFPSQVKQGDPVYVFDGKTEVRPIGAAREPAGDGGRDGAPLTEPPEGWLDGQPPLRPTRPGSGEEGPEGILA